MKHLVRNYGDDARAEELNNLKLALATFVLQLDVFEMRMQEGLPKGLPKELPKLSKPRQPVPRTDGGGGPRKDN
jgi:hypothetical protein